ncbi:MAG TPA: hypothetical protein VIZ22_04620 [Candidatus Limnocylindrales bacterium]
MAPVVALGGLVVLSLLAVAATLRSAPGGVPGRELSFRMALPWIVAAVSLVGLLLVALPGVPWLVIAGLMAYAGVAVAAMWRLVRLDRASPWMAPAHRTARIAISIVALIWLGIVFGLLLWIAASIAGAPYGP